MAKNKKRYAITMEFVVAIIIVAIAAALFFAVPSQLFKAVALFAIALFASVYFVLRLYYRRRWVYTAENILERNSDKVYAYSKPETLPTAIISKTGKIYWGNTPFHQLAGCSLLGNNIYRIFPELEKADINKKVIIGKTEYFKEIIPVAYGGKDYTLYRLIDVKNTFTPVELSQMSICAVMHIMIDNYGDMIRAIPPASQSEVTSRLDAIVSNYAEMIYAAYQKYDRNKYMITFESGRLPLLVNDKFGILSEVKSISTGAVNMKPTISIGVGAGSTPGESNSYALKALEMALGRGGDQAVIKDKSGFKFYGGVQQGRESQSRVRIRTFANALRNLMEQSDEVIVMGHEAPDLDAMGAALGICACARSMKKDCFIILDEPNDSIEGLLAELKKEPGKRELFISSTDAENRLDAHTLLVIVDTQIANFTIAPQLIQKAKSVVVIDHHLRGTDYIENPTLSLYETYASSASEMVTEVLQYFGEDMKITAAEAEALLAGISVDTKGFSFNTGVRTFEAASYLRSLGANTRIVRDFFLEDLDTFKKRSQIVQNAEVLKNGIAIAMWEEDLQTPQLLAAQAADELMGIKGVDAAFVLCRKDETIMISGRSRGRVNVQMVLEKLSGGGHASSAGAQLTGIGMREAKEKLVGAIKDYEKESL